MMSSSLDTIGSSSVRVVVVVVVAITFGAARIRDAGKSFTTAVMKRSKFSWQRSVAKGVLDVDVFGGRLEAERRYGCSTALLLFVDLLGPLPTSSLDSSIYI